MQHLAGFVVAVLVDLVVVLAGGDVAEHLDRMRQRRDSERVINQDSASAKARARAVIAAVRLRQVVTCDRRCWTAAFIARS